MLNTRYISSIFKGKIVTFSDGPNDLFDDAMYTMGYPVTVNGRVIAAIFVNTPVTVMLSAIHVAYQIIFLITFLTTTIAFVLIYYSAKKSVLPILQLSEMAKVIADGDFEKRIEVNMGGEVAQLAESFNNMAAVLDKKSKIRRDYMLNISHDLRSPLTSILGFLQAIIDGTVPPEKVNYYLKIIYSETERLSKLTNNILDLDTIESGGEKLNISQFDIVQLITDTLMKLEKRIGDKNIDVDFTISSGEIFVSADKEKIERVIYNLLDNALKFLSENGKLILDVNSDGKKAHISIADNGIGMTEEEQKRAFERFYKADSSRGKDKKGSGLGLPIVQVLLKAHNETIHLESEKDKGTKFSFSLPLAGNKTDPKL
jgi:signal transduction histidine kinase